MRYDVSFAALFSRGHMLDPFCAVCFYSDLPAKGAADDVHGYLVRRLVPGLVQTIASKDRQAVLCELRIALKTMNDALGVQCSAFMPDSVLTIQSGGHREKGRGEAAIITEEGNACSLRAAGPDGGRLCSGPRQTSLLLSVLLPQREAQPCVCQYALIRMLQGSYGEFERCMHEPAMLCSLCLCLEDGGEEPLAAMQGLLGHAVGVPVDIWPISKVGYYHLE